MQRVTSKMKARVQRLWARTQVYLSKTKLGNYKQVFGNGRVAKERQIESHESSITLLSNDSSTSGISSCKSFFYYIFYVNDLVLPEKWL